MIHTQQNIPYTIIDKVIHSDRFLLMKCLDLNNFWVGTSTYIGPKKHVLPIGNDEIFTNLLAQPFVR